MKRIALVGAVMLTAATVPLGAQASAGPAARSVSACPGVCATPAPTGQNAVGRTVLPTDTSRATFWYPAVRGSGVAAPLLSPAVAAAVSDAFGLPDLSGLATFARTDAEIKPGGRRPVLLLSPGFGLVSELYTATAEELASHGWIVVGVDPGIEDPTSIPTQEQLERRISDLHKTVEWLADGGHPLADDIDMTRLGVLGHSFGGAAAFNSVGRGGIRSAVNLDGSVFGDVLETGTRGPALLVSSLPCLDPTQQALASVSPVGLQARHMQGTTHYSFTDIVHFGGDAGGTLDAGTVAATQRRLLLRWFQDTVLSHRSADARVVRSAVLADLNTPCSLRASTSA